MGKWSHLVGKVPNLPVDPSYEQALYARVDELSTLDKADLAERYALLDQVKNTLDKASKDLDFDMTAITMLMSKRFQDEGLESAVIGGYRWTPKPDPYAQVKDKAEFLKWALEHMQSNLQIPWPTLNSIVKANLESGEELPPGVDVFLKRSFTRTKQK